MASTSRCIAASCSASLECNADGVADFYGELLDGMIADENVARLPTLQTDTRMDDAASRATWRNGGRSQSRGRDAHASVPVGHWRVQDPRVHRRASEQGQWTLEGLLRPGGEGRLPDPGWKAHQRSGQPQ